MTPKEIREIDLYSNHGVFLREIAAQLAEIAEALRTRNTKTTGPRKPKEITSTARHSSNGKTFRVHHWGTTVTPSMLPEFEPNEGQKHFNELAPEETTIGRLGTTLNAQVTRKQ